MNTFGPKQVWTNPGSAEGKPSLFRLTPDALELAIVPKGALEEADLHREPQGAFSTQRIPLAAIVRLEGEESGTDLTVTYRLEDGKDSSATIGLVDGPQRDEMLDALAARLGTFWIREIRPAPRWKGLLWPLAIAGLIGFLTWIMHHEAERLAAGEKLKAGRGRLGVIRQLMHWIEREIGPDGVLIAGGILGTLAILWFLVAAARPPMRIVILP